MRKSVQVHQRNVFAMDEAVVRAKTSVNQEDSIMMTAAAVDAVRPMISSQDDGIVPFAAVDAIRAPAREQLIGAGTAVHCVVATLTTQAIGPTEPSESVGASESTYAVFAGGSDEIVRPISTLDEHCRR